MYTRALEHGVCQGCGRGPAHAPDALAAGAHDSLEDDEVPQLGKVQIRAGGGGQVGRRRGEGVCSGCVSGGRSLRQQALPSKLWTAQRIPPHPGVLQGSEGKKDIRLVVPTPSGACSEAFRPNALRPPSFCSRCTPEEVARP